MDLQKIAGELNGMICTTHNEYAKVSANNDGLSISTCCDSFKEEVIKAMDNKINRALDEDIDQAFTF